MKKIFIIIVFLGSISYGCALCRKSIPQVSVYTKIYPQKDSTLFKVKWKFHKAFTSMLGPYDRNSDNHFDKDEIKDLYDNLVGYIKDFNYLTEVEYRKKDKEFRSKFIKLHLVNRGKISFVKGAMVFEYSFTIPIVLDKNHKLSISYFDNTGNFGFIFSDVILKNYKDFYVIKPAYYQTYIYFFKDFTNQPEQVQMREDIQASNAPDKAIAPNYTKEATTQKSKFSPIVILSNALNNLKNRLKTTLKNIKDNNSVLSYMWLLIFSFLYGVLHAVGPGHGKTLVSSYFMQKEQSYFKAFSIASLIGVVHTFSAFLLTLIVYYVIGLMFSSTLVNIEQITTKVSAIIIILIALYMLRQKYKRDHIRKAPYFSVVKPNSPNVTTHHHHSGSSCSCSACKTTSTDLGVILAAGIVPCPGTVTIFLFTMSLGVYFIGFLSALFMSIGMSLIIFITAIVAIKVRKKSSTNTKLIKFLEYASLFFILGLGILLFLIA